VANKTGNYNLVELRGVHTDKKGGVHDDKIKVIDSGDRLAMEAKANELSTKALNEGFTLTQLRYAVRVG